MKTSNILNSIKYDLAENGIIRREDLLTYEADNYMDNKFTLLLMDLQANILKFHGKKKAVLSFFKFSKKVKHDTKLLSSLYCWLDSLKITSAKEQINQFNNSPVGDQNNDRTAKLISNYTDLGEMLKENRGEILLGRDIQNGEDGEAIICFYLSYAGYKFFGEEKRWDLMSNDDPFKKGMLDLVEDTFLKESNDVIDNLKEKIKGLKELENSTRNKRLKIKIIDERTKMEAEVKEKEGINDKLKKSQENAGEWHAMVLVASDTINLNHKMSEFEDLQDNGICEKVTSQTAKLNPEGKKGESREWFGFSDGISNPRFFPNKKRRNDPNAEAPSKLDLVLRPCFGPQMDSCGSFMAFMKLKQNIGLFETITKGLADKLPNQEGIAKAGALIIGRHQDGTPLTLSENPELGYENKFDYSNDKLGLKCPFHAHIRKANPRDGAEYKRIVRRGMIYGDKDSGGDKGLHFISFQSDLREQFENMVRRWLFGYDYRGRNTGTDILLSMDDTYQSYWKNWGDGFGDKVSIPDGLRNNEPLVTFEWGQYFFAPSISYIKKTLLEKIESRITVLKKGI